MQNISKKITSGLRLFGSEAAIGRGMGTNDSNLFLDDDICNEYEQLFEVNRKLKKFVKVFVKVFEAKLIHYYEEIKVGVKTQKVGKLAETVTLSSETLSRVPIVKQAIIPVLNESVRYFGKKKHREKAKRIVEMFRHIRKSDLREVLVKASGSVFQNLESQFVVVTDMGESWTRAIEKLAVDAVDRVMSYVNNYKEKNPNVQVEDYFDLITKAIILGKSKVRMSTSITPESIKNCMLRSGYTIKNKRMKFKTADLYEKVGIVIINGNGDYDKYYRKRGVAYTSDYGYRLPFKWETLSDYIECQEGPLESYQYTLNLNKIKHELETILSEINRPSIKEEHVNILEIVHGIGVLEKAMILEERSENLSEFEEKGLSPLHKAIIEGNELSVSFFLNKDIDVFAKTTLDNNALHLAVRGGYVNIVNILLDHVGQTDSCKLNEFINSSGYKGQTPIHYATRYPEILCILINEERFGKIDFNARTTNPGSTPLHFAAKNGDLKTVNILLNYIGNTNYNKLSEFVNALSMDNSTPLHFASLNGHLEIVKALLASNADIHAKNKDNKTPLDIAAENNYLEIVECLVRKGAHYQSKGPIYFYMKKPVELFTGREGELSQINKALQCNKDGIRVMPQMISITGLGEIGKSELARKYACDHVKDYDGNVIWINAENYETLVESFLKLARDNRVSISIKDERDIKYIVNEVYVFFAKRKSLFIFDNAERYRTKKKEDGSEEVGIDRFLPFSFLSSNVNKFSFLITSRNQKWENVEVLQLDKFAENEAKEFIKKALKIEDGLQENEVKELAETLQNFPLALQQAVSYIKVKNEKLRNVGSEFTISDYLQKYKERAKDFLNFPFLEDSDNSYAKTIFIIWKISLEAIKKKKCGEEAVGILNIMAYFASNNISVKMFLKLIEDNEKLEPIIELLKQYSMVTSEEQGMLNIYRIVQQAIRLELKEQSKEKEALMAALKLVETDIRKENLDHSISVWGYASKYEELVRKFSELPIRIMSELSGSIRYKEAYVFGRQASTLLENIWGHDCADALKIKCSIALLLSSQNRHAEALQVFQEVFDIQKEILGSNHPEILRLKSNMASLLFNLGKYDKALQIFQEVVNTQKEILDPDHPDILVVEHNIALLLGSKGRYAEALQAFQRVFNIQKEILGPNHPLSLRTKKNMALVLYDQGKYDEALQAFQEVFDIQKKVLGLALHHPSILKIKKNISLLLYKQGKYNEALQAFREIFDIQKEILGLDHPSSLRVKNNVGLALYKQGKYAEALQVFQEVFDIQKKTLGFGHPDTLKTRENIALMLYEQNKYNEALQVFQEVFDIQKKTLGFGHPDTLKTKGNIALIFYKQDKCDEALQSFQEILDMQEEDLNNHPNSLVIRHNMAVVLSNQGKYDEALRTYTEIFDIQKETLVLNHSDTLTTKHNIAVVLEKQSKYNEALQVFQEVFDIQKKTLGFDHPDTLITKYNIDVVVEKWGKSIDLIPMHIAAENGNLEVIKHLLEKGAGVNVFDRFGITPIHIAAENGNLEVIKHLLEKGADVNVFDRFGITPIHIAAENGDLEVIKHLLEKGADFKAADDNSMSPIHIAARNGNLEVIKYLLEKGADFKAPGNNSMAPIHIAAENGNLEVIKYFLDKGDDANTLDRFGRTPLHLAVLKNHKDTVKLLLENGAIYNLKDKENKIPLKLAKVNSEIWQLLGFIDKLFNAFGSKDQNEVSNILESVQSYNFITVVVNTRNSQNYTPLDLAYEHYYPRTNSQVITSLLQYGARVSSSFDYLYEVSSVFDNKIHSRQ